MTKRQNRGNFICMILCGILELLVIISAYGVHYFTKTRMGMLRHMVYLNSKWENAVPIPTIKWIAICIITALIIIQYLRYRKRKVHYHVNTMVKLLTIAISGWTVYFLLFYNTGRNRAYYILSICFILGTALQNILHHCFFSIKSRN